MSEMCHAICCLMLYIASAGCVWTPEDLRGRHYNPHRPPLVNGTETVFIYLKLGIVTILDVSELGQSFTVDLDYTLTWNDYRVSYPQTERSVSPLVLDLSWKEKLWIPDIYFKNALDTHLVQGTISPITHLAVSHNSDVSLNARMTVRLICDMELFAYPHDRQQCFLDSTSLSHEPDLIQLVWDRFSIDETIYFPKFTIDSYATAPNCSSPDIHNVGTKTCARAILNFSRKTSFYVTRFYAPTILITTATFLGYYVDPGVANARIAINMTPFLALVIMHNVINQELRASYVVAIHIWMFICMFFTFMGLVEFWLAQAVHDHNKKQKKKEEKLKKEQKEREATSSTENLASRCQDVSLRIRTPVNQDFKIIMSTNGGSASGVVFTRSKENASLLERMWHLVHGGGTGGGCGGDVGAGKGRRRKDSDRNVVDAIARPLVPLCYITFVVSYFVYFTHYPHFEPFQL